jgi:hypothetical protein
MTRVARGDAGRVEPAALGRVLAPVTNSPLPRRPVLMAKPYEGHLTLAHKIRPSAGPQQAPILRLLG